MNRYANWLEMHRGLAAGLVVVITCVALAGSVRLRFDVNIRNLFRSDDQRMEVLEAIYDDFGTDDYDCIVLLEAEDLFTPESVAVIRALSDQARQLKEVHAVFSLADAVVLDEANGAQTLLPPPEASPAAFEEARRKALSHPLTVQRVISEDGRTAMVLVRLDADVDYLAFLQDRDNPLRRLIGEVVEGTAVDATLTGIPVVRAELLGELQREQIRFLFISGGIGLLVGVVLFRRVIAVLVVSLAALTGTVWLIGLVAWIGEPVNPVNVVIPTLVLVIGFADAVHMLHVVRTLIGAGETPRAAAGIALRRVGPACGLTSLTTAIGFGSLAVARLDVIERFGITAAAGIFLSFLAVITLVPLLVTTPLGRRIGQVPPRPPTDVPRPIALVLRRARLTAVMGIALTVLFASLSTRLYPSSWLREGLPRSSPAAQGVEKIDASFGGILSVVVLLEWDGRPSLATPGVLEALTQAEAVLAKERMLGPPLSILDVLRVLPGPAGASREKLALLPLVPSKLVQRVARPDRHRAIVIANVPDNGTHRHAPVLNSIEEELRILESSLSGLRFTLTGIPVAVGQSARYMIEDLVISLALAAGVIFAVMTVAFRSIVLGLMTLVPNVFPLVVAGSFLVLTDHPLTVTGVITFCVCLGIAVDDTIHFVVRARQACAEGAPVALAVKIAVKEVGAAMIATTAVLVGGFGAVLVSDMPMLVLFGGLCCLALLAALLGDLVILPAMLIAWWRPKDAQSSSERS